MTKSLETAGSLERRAQELARLLTDQDVETLSHLVNQGMGDNTQCALASKLAYLRAWSFGRRLAPPSSGRRQKGLL